MGEAETLHGSCVLLGEDAVLVRGAAGAGKSTLCRDLIAAAAASGLFARMVSDDRTQVEARHGRLVARPVQPLAGLLETRFVGIHPVPHEPAARLSLVVDLVNGSPPRMPEEAAGAVDLCGIRLPRLQLPQGRPLAETVLTNLRLIRTADRDTLVTL